MLYVVMIRRLVGNFNNKTNMKCIRVLFSINERFFNTGQ